MAKKVTKSGYEHIKLKDSGDIDGLWLIDGHKVRDVFGAKRYWEGIDEIMRLYKEIHPNEWQDMVIHNQLEKDDSKNATGSNQSGAVRHALSVPYPLYLVLHDYDDQIIKDKNKRHLLMKRYPVIRACQTV